GVREGGVEGSGRWGGGLGGRGWGLRTSFDGRLRRLHPRPQYVRADPRPLAGPELEGLVGRQSALSRADLRADASSARSDRDGRRHHLHLCDQGYQGSTGSGEASRQWSRREDRRRCRDCASISSRGIDRRAAFGLVPRRARERRSNVRRDCPAGARLPRHRTPGDRTRHPHRSQPIGAHLPLAAEVRMWDRFFDNYVSYPQGRLVFMASGREPDDGKGGAAWKSMLETSYALLDRRMAG